MSNLTCQSCNSTFSNLGNLNKHRATNKKCNSTIPIIPESIPNNGIGGMMNLLLEIKSIVSNKEENNMIRLLKEEIRMMKEKEKDMIYLLKEEICMMKEKEKDEVKGLKKEIELLKESHSIEIKTLKAKFQEVKEKKEVKEVKEVVKEVVKQVKEKKKEEEEDLSMFETRADGFTHIGGVSYSKMKAIKAIYLKTQKISLPAKEFKNTPENINRIKRYLGISVKPIEEKKEELHVEEEVKEEEEEEEEETDDDKNFGEYCEKDEYGFYHIGGIQSDSLMRLKSFYSTIPENLLFGERKTKCTDKMDYLKREFASKFLNDFSGTKDDFNKLKFYLEN